MNTLSNAVAAVAVAVTALTASAQAQLSGTTSHEHGAPPCPMWMEILCNQTLPIKDEYDDPTPAPMCSCGTGSWIRTVPIFQGSPAVPLAEINVPVSINGTSWVASREASAQPCHAEVHVSGFGSSNFWRAGSLTRSAAARYSHLTRELWQGSGIPCPRLLSLAATGSAGLSLTLTCSAAPGCGASGTSTVSGACSSLGDASASIENKKVDGSVAYEEGSESTEIEGHFGASIDDSSASVNGMISRIEQWSVHGSGNVSGSAGYTVKEDRNYCAFTNRSVTRLSIGVVLCAAGATVDDNGSSAFDARAFVSLAVD